MIIKDKQSLGEFVAIFLTVMCSTVVFVIIPAVMTIICDEP
jgi:hypothetical protein